MFMRLKWKRLFRLFRCLSFALLLAFNLSSLNTSCSLRRSGLIRVSGSTTLLPMVQEAANRFMAAYPGSTVLVQGGGSSVGIAQLNEGIMDIANSSRELKESEDRGDLVDHKVALDVIALIVHPDVGVESLTREQVRDIFTGKIVNWKDLGGADGTIVVVMRDRSSGTREMFDKVALGGEEPVGSAIECNSNGIMRETIASTKNSIGYISIGYVNSTIKAIKFEGVEPGAKSAKEGAYPLSRFLHMYTKGEPSGRVADFIAYILSEDFQKEVVSKEYIPVTEL